VRLLRYLIPRGSLPIQVIRREVDTVVVIGNTKGDPTSAVAVGAFVNEGDVGGGGGGGGGGGDGRLYVNSSASTIAVDPSDVTTETSAVPAVAGGDTA